MDDKNQPQVKTEYRLEDFIDPNEELRPDWEVKVQQMPNGAQIPKPDRYTKECDEVAFQALAKAGGSVAAACVALRCSKPTYYSWVEKHPTFERAVKIGKTIGEHEYRNRIMDNAFAPSQLVNNGLIKLIAKNVYGIDDEPPQVVVNNNQNNTVVADGETAALYKSALESEEKGEGEGWKE